VCDHGRVLDCLHLFWTTAGADGYGGGSRIDRGQISSRYDGEAIHASYKIVVIGYWCTELVMVHDRWSIKVVSKIGSTGAGVAYH